MNGVDLQQFYARTRHARKIVVVDMGFLGDTAHLIPSLCEIADKYPQAELHVLSSPLACEVLKMTPCVTKTWSFPLGPPSPSWWEHWGILRALRREKFDVAFNFSGADRSVFSTIIIGAREAMAYGGARKHFWQPWLIKNWIPRRALPTPAYEGRRHLLELCGFQLKLPHFNLAIPEADLKWAQESIPEGSIHLSLSASFALKEWPMANNIQLARFLVNQNPGIKIIVTAAPNPREQTRLQQFRREIVDTRVMEFNERLSISRLAALLNRCAMHVGPDSGVIHLATALDIPTVSIFRRYASMADFAPVGAKHICFDAPCPCMSSKNPPCRATGEAACLAAISPELVGKEILHRLSPSDFKKE